MHMGGADVMHHTFLALALGVGGQRYALAALPPETTEQEVGWPQSQSGCFEKGNLLLLSGINTRFLGYTVHSLSPYQLPYPGS